MLSFVVPGDGVGVADVELQALGRGIRQRDLFGGARPLAAREVGEVGGAFVVEQPEGECLPMAVSASVSSAA